MESGPNSFPGTISFKYMVATGVVSLALSAISAAFTYKNVENLDQNQKNVRHYLLPLQFALTILWLFLMWRTTSCGNYYVTLLLFVVSSLILVIQSEMTDKTAVGFQSIFLAWTVYAAYITFGYCILNENAT